MATPIYHSSWARGGPWSLSSGRRWGVVYRAGSWFGGGTPQYDGPGQPALDSDRAIGRGTPRYMAAPPPPLIVAQDTAATPQPNPVAIVVPRS